jgi:hypothetical protein
MNGDGWHPTTVRRFIESYPTSTNVVRVDTDAGEGFLKALGNPEGPHVLACELVGTLLARWLGLPTLEHAIIWITGDDEIPLPSGRLAAPGPAFITKAEEGFPWGGDVATIRNTRRPRDVARLVALDTWIRNCDRYRPEPNRRVNRDNVFLAKRIEPERGLVLMAIDHTHAFTCGGELTRRIGGLDSVRDTTVFGCFPEFVSLLEQTEMQACAARLGEMRLQVAEEFVARVPGEWRVEQSVRTAWAGFIADRATFLAANITSWLWP